MDSLEGDIQTFREHCMHFLRHHDASAGVNFGITPGFRESPGLSQSLCSVKRKINNTNIQRMLGGFYRAPTQQRVAITNDCHTAL